MMTVADQLTALILVSSKYRQYDMILPLLKVIRDKAEANETLLSSYLVTLDYNAEGELVDIIRAVICPEEDTS